MAIRPHTSSSKFFVSESLPLAMALAFKLRLVLLTVQTSKSNGDLT